MYALSTTLSYQDDLNDLLNQHSQILADKFVFIFLNNRHGGGRFCFSRTLQKCINSQDFSVPKCSTVRLNGSH
jgi:23S rRNA G2069 N7-methylase RlmK/C1962 C5-methylase RlmI